MTSFCVIGHVDTGKSTICGRILLKTNTVSREEFTAIERQVQRDGSQHMLYARILDYCAEEQARGKTHESSSYDISFNGRAYCLVDTPGHKEFIREMISGITLNKCRVAVLIVSAKTGEFESSFDKSGQTKEDILLARAFDIQHIIVMVNKMDTCGPARYDEIVGKICPFLEKLNFSSVHCLPVSGFKGEGLDALFDVLEGLPALEPSHLGERCLATAFKGTFRLLTNELVSSGWLGMAHTEAGHEYEVQVAMDGFVHKQGDAATLTLTFAQSQEIARNERIVLRKNDKTVAFGRVKLIKPANMKEKNKLIS